MGLMDVLNGMMNGPRGQADARPAGGSHGGMSPLTMGLLALLAYKTMKGGGLFGGQQAPQQAPGAPANYPNQGAGGGGLDNWLSGLGGLLAGGAGGSVLSGGLNELLRRFHREIVTASDDLSRHQLWAKRPEAHQAEGRATIEHRRKRGGAEGPHR